MTEREIIQRLHGLCQLTDGLRAPNHRHTVEGYVAEREAIRDGVRRLYRDVTGEWPGDQVPTGPERRARPAVPTALLRHRERLAARRPAPARTA